MKGYFAIMLQNTQTFYLSRIIKKTLMSIPIGNSKEDFKTREEIISQVYRRWIEENPDKRIYNRSLKDYINIRYLSITETMRHAAKSYY